MAGITARTAGTAAVTLVLAAVGLVSTSGPAAAYGQCVRTVPADHYSVSVSCPDRQNGMQFRVVTYSCSSMYSDCGSTPVYGEWAQWGGTSSVYVGPSYVDIARVSVDVGYPDPV